MGRCLALATLLLVLPTHAWSQVANEVPLRSGRRVLSAETTRQFLRLAHESRDGLHGLAVLRRPPSEADRQRLAGRGLILLNRLTRHAYVTWVSRSARLGDSSVIAPVRFLSPVEARDRVAPDIWNSQFDRYVLRTTSPHGNSVLNPDGTVNVLIRFHDDVPPPIAQRVLSQYQTARAIRKGLWRAVMSVASVRTLADDDRVRWIDAAPRAAGPDVDEARLALNVDEIQGFDAALGVATGLTGAGIQVGVYDGGIDTAHDAFDGPGGASRVVVALPIDSSHATYVAGIIAGNGARSDTKDSWDKDNGGVAHQWRGIAPAAELIDAAKVEEPLASNAATLRNHITAHGMDLSNHSYWLETDGMYNEENELHDALIRGDDAGDDAPLPPRLHVHSAGNFGMLPKDGNQRGYFSLGNQLKNALVVGAYYVFAERVAISSSLGPTHDGRIKPDVVAPGAYVVSTGFCTATDNPEFLPFQEATATARPCNGKPAGKVFPRRDFYFPRSGTSAATAATTGVLTLVLHELASAHGVNLNASPPLPSTLRGLVIHSAGDLVDTPEVMTADGTDSMPLRTFKGPDFVSGFGVVDAAEAVDVVRRRVLLEGVIGATCETKTYTLHVPKGSFAPVKVTLAWDDPATDAPEIANDQPRLINDLDLVLTSPLGMKFYPWLLDQEITDLAGTVLPNSAQTCGTDVLVSRKLTPTPTPNYQTDADGNELPGIIDDPIDEADLLPAATGKDHLNNVEQVVAPWSPGNWRVEVSGFRIEQAPQRFSLIGIPPARRLSFRPIDLCKKFAFMCENRLMKLCFTFATLCKAPDFTLVRGDSLVIRFRDPADRKVIELSSLCHALDADPTCADIAGGRSPELELTLGPMTRSLGVELFDARGSLLSRDVSDERIKRIRVPPSTAPVFLFLSPGRGVEAGVEYAGPVAIRRRS